MLAGGTFAPRFATLVASVAGIWVSGFSIPLRAVNECDAKVAPGAAFSASCSLTTCSFELTSSIPASGISKLEWDFGDRATAEGTALTVSHAYAGGGYYLVTLVVYSFGARSRSYVNVTSVDGAGALNLLDLTLDSNTGLAKESRDSAQRPTTFAMDLMGRLEKSSPRGDAPTSIDYNPLEFLPPLVEMSVGTGTTLARQKWALDGLGRLAGAEVALPAAQASSTLTLYNAMGWKTFVTEPGSSAITQYRLYDPFGRPGEVVTADGKATKIEYKGVRVVLKTSLVYIGTAEKWVTSREEYDGLGRLRRIREPNGTWTRYAYDVGGRLATVVHNSGASSTQIRTFAYDGRGFLAKDVQPESGTTTTSMMSKAT